MENRPYYFVEETFENGVLVRFFDFDLADEFDDYISEEVYVLSNIAFMENEVVFYFGQASSIEKVDKIIDDFFKVKRMTSLSNK